MTWDIDKNMPALPGKVAIVTGGNTGIGKEIVRQLARRGAKVYMASRTESRANAAIEEIIAEHPEIAEKGGSIAFLELNLRDLKACQAAAQEFLQKEERLDILVNNAGIMATPFELTQDGFEVQFQTNHLGHFAFTLPLLPMIIETAKDPSNSVRIVQVSSYGHEIFSSPDINFDSIESVNRDFGSSFKRYGQSKLANILFSNELSRRLAEYRIWCNSIHPGTVKTEITRGTAESHPWAKPLLRILTPVFGAFMFTPYKGALTALYAATAEEIEKDDMRGKYFVPLATQAQPSKQAQDEQLGRQLWEFSEKMITEKCGGLS
ncbi:NAD(P)-binding protein [Pluteus cervinus]|uniref:NAD(P)-binding protein n=1 Tax=Pluteus cervinus TaxID=181527 RepID=A0ACD3AVW3_9AGAR|nr:NAD(P)-binding protein [Pluteus cervinus]